MVSFKSEPPYVILPSAPTNCALFESAVGPPSRWRAEACLPRPPLFQCTGFVYCMFCRCNPRLPQELICAIKQQQLLPTRWILSISVADQTMRLLERSNHQANAWFPRYILRQKYRVSTAAKGAGQEINSNRTPLGLHRVAEKIGGGQPIGTVFRNRQPVGLTWQGLPAGSIVHRILWLEGLQLLDLIFLQRTSL